MTAKQLQGQGTVYFVPVGKVQPGITESLAEHFRWKLGLQVTVLPAITAVQRHERERKRPWPLRLLDALRPAQQEEAQLWAEEILQQLPLSNPQQAQDQQAILIGITGEDLAPRDYNWEFTFGWRSQERRSAIVSSARMGKMPDGKVDPNQLISDLRKMVMKDIGVLYYQLPLNNDPTSLLYNSIDLYFAGDDFYESDLHPELMPWGRYGSTDPCLTLVYDYSQAAVEPGTAVQDCDPEKETEHPRREKFTLDLRYGLFIDRKTDFFFKDSPPILFRRVYRTRDVWDRAFGWGANHSYNSFLTTQSQFPFAYVDLVFDDGSHIRFQRTSADLGLSQFTRFDTQAEGTYCRSQLTWDGTLFHINLRDGASYTYLPCGGVTPCYLMGFRDTAGKLLEIQRDPYLNLQRVKSATSFVDFASDQQKHIIRATDHLGNEVKYQHNPSGDVEAVYYPDGQIARYSYDGAHQMLSAWIESGEGKRPLSLFENEYDGNGRVAKYTVAKGVKYQVEYRLNSQKNVVETIVTEPSGAVTRLRFGGGSEYALWYQPAREAITKGSAGRPSGF